jgi:predicted CoA-binding protein
MTHQSDDDSELRDILADASTIAVIGIKDEASADANRIPRYMQSQGTRIVPINPKLDSALGESAYPSLEQVDVGVDLVNIFRAPEHIPGHIDEILAMSPRPRAVWMQLGIYHGAAAAQLRRAGIRVVQDRCIMLEHRRLLGAEA